MVNFNSFNVGNTLGVNSFDPLTANASQQGGLVPSAFNVQPNISGNNTGMTLPASKVPDFRVGQFKRDIIHWFVPEFGIVKQYVNASNITTHFKKLIHKDRTKGGYTLQYWGEELPTMTLTGTTGSSGIEGINVLYEIYRAEQYAFDAVGLSLAADNAILGATNQILDGVGGAVADAIGTSVGNQTVGGIVGSSLANAILGADNAGTFAPRNITSLAQLAFGVEMYYSGQISRGYFESFDLTESADSIGLFNYTINFTITQRRGYRVNKFPWQRSAISGYSDNDTSGGRPFSWERIG